VAEYYSEYKQCFEGAGTNPGEKTLEDKFFEYEVFIQCCGTVTIYGSVPTFEK
jgi:hypothetical protein